MTLSDSILLATIAGAACLLALSHYSRAAGFDARPVTIETRSGNIASITVSNPGDHKIYLENTVHEWRQDASGQDILTESPAAVVSPPGMWVQPGASYNLRLQLPPATDRELAFRVMLQQLPDKSEIQAGRIVLAVTQLLPAFSEPPQPTPPVLHARVADPHHLMITNDRGRRADRRSRIGRLCVGSFQRAGHAEIAGSRRPDRNRNRSRPAYRRRALTGRAVGCQ